MAIRREHLERAASETGFSVDALEKVGVLARLLDLIGAHPFLGPRLALKGGTALNLFRFELPRPCRKRPSRNLPDAIGNRLLGATA